MLMKQIIDAYEVLDSAYVTGKKVEGILRTIQPDADITVYELKGPKGTTDMLKVRIPGTNGKTKGGSAPTIGLFGRFGRDLVPVRNESDLYRMETAPWQQWPWQPNFWICKIKAIC